MPHNNYKKPIIVKSDGSLDKLDKLDKLEYEVSIMTTQHSQHSPHTDPAVRLAVVESKIETSAKLMDRLTDSITAIRDVAKNMQELVNIHELKLEQRAEGEKGIYAHIKKEHEQMSERIKRVENDGEEARKELTLQVKQLREETNSNLSEMKDEIKTTISSSLKPLIDDVEAIKKRNETFDRIRWVAVGASIIALLMIPGGAKFLVGLFT